MENVVVIGASENEERYSNKAMKMLAEYGHNPIPVAPARQTILDRKVYGRASDITEKVQNIAPAASGSKEKVPHYDDVDLGQMTLFDTKKDEDVINELKDIDITNLTPVDALNTLYRLQSELKNRFMPKQ